MGVVDVVAIVGVVAECLPGRGDSEVDVGRLGHPDGDVVQDVRQFREELVPEGVGLRAFAQRRAPKPKASPPLGPGDGVKQVGRAARADDPGGTPKCLLLGAWAPDPLGRDHDGRPRFAPLLAMRAGDISTIRRLSQRSNLPSNKHVRLLCVVPMSPGTGVSVVGRGGVRTPAFPLRFSCRAPKTAAQFSGDRQEDTGVSTLDTASPKPSRVRRCSVPALDIGWLQGVWANASAELQFTANAAPPRVGSTVRSPMAVIVVHAGTG